MDQDPSILALRVPEVARRLGVGKNTIYRACADGRLPAIRLGKRFLISVRTLDQWLEQGGKL